MEAYFKAKEIDLSLEFIRLLEKEINNRGLIVSNNHRKIVFTQENMVERSKQNNE